MKNVSCEYDRWNGWNSTLQAAWCVIHQTRSLDVLNLYLVFHLWYVWCLSTKPTIWLLILSFTAVFTQGRSRVLEKDQQELVSAPPSMGKHSSAQVDEGRNSWHLLAIKMQGTNPSGEGVEEPAMWPRIWVTTKRERKRRAKIINGIKKQRRRTRQFTARNAWTTAVQLPVIPDTSTFYSRYLVLNLPNILSKPTTQE